MARHQRMANASGNFEAHPRKTDSTSADLSSAWSLLTTWLAVVAILLAALSSSFGVWALWGALVFTAAFTGMLIKIGSIVEHHTDRTRHAGVWLAALEDGSIIRSPRNPIWPWSR